MSHDSFGDRMKQYEATSEQVLPPGLPVILRFDGNSFSRFTEEFGFEKPFDARFERALEAATLDLMEYFSGVARIAYLQSDEVTVLLVNNPREKPFLGNRTQKLASIPTSRLTAAFNEALFRDTGRFARAAFDARVFVVPPHEVVNAFLWRQLDAFKNCLSAVSYYGLVEKYGCKQEATRRLHGVSSKDRQELIFRELGINPNDIETEHKRGRCIVRTTREVPIQDHLETSTLLRLLDAGHVGEDDVVQRSEWVVDREIPRFDHDRTYIESRARIITEEAA